jgi:hypothetical protein
MMTFRHWAGRLAVLFCACLMPAAPLGAQTLPPPPQEWASAAALGDVFVGTQTQDAAPLPLIKIFGHGCPATSSPPACPKEQITLGTTPASITGFAFRTEGSQYNLYVATTAGTIWKVLGTPTASGARPDPIPFLTELSTNIRALKFDENGILHVSYGGSDPRIEIYDPARTSSPPLVHRVQCDVNPAPGLWFDLTARTLTNPPKQFAVYACGGTQIRSLDALSEPPPLTIPPTKTDSTLFATLPNLPGNTETARDLILLAPTTALPAAAQSELDTVRGVQGGLVIAYGTNLQRLDRFGGVLGSGFDFGSGSASTNAWSSVTLSPTGGSVWGAAADTSFLTRFPLGSGFSSQPEVRFNTSSVLPVTAVIANGVPNLAAAMQLVTVNREVAATYLKGTKWEHSIKFEVFKASPDDDVLDPQYSSVRMAVTSFEGQTAPETGETAYPLFTDLSLDGRLTRFPEARAFKTSRGRGNFYRMIPQSSPAVPVTVDVRVTISYIHEEFTPTASVLTGLYDDLNHSDRGFLTAPGLVNATDPEGPTGSTLGLVNLFDKNIRDEWFKTDSTARGSTKTSNDYLIGVQTGTRVTLDSFKTSVKLGSSLPIRATYSFPVTPTFCAGLVLTAARDGSPFVIVGSSLTTLNHLGEGIPFFTPAGTTAPNTCRANLDVVSGSNEEPPPPNGPDFAAGQRYNLCVVFKDLETLPANTTPPADVCETTLVK